MLTRDEVMWAYRMLLGRDPESEDVIRQCCLLSNAEDLRRSILDGGEFAALYAPMAPVNAGAEFHYRNRLYWQCVERETVPGGAIVVDLMHDNVEYLLRSLVIARAVRHATGFRIVGLLGRSGVVSTSCPNYNSEANRDLAASFGIAEFETVPEILCPHGTTAVVAAHLKAIALLVQDGEAFPETVLGLFNQVTCEDGYPLGRTVQETYMRSELMPTLYAGTALFNVIDEVAGFHEWASEFVTRREPAAFATGHIDYSPWGHLGSLIARAGGRVAWFRCDTRIPVHIVGSGVRLGTCPTLNSEVRREEGRAFMRFDRTRGRAMGGASASRFDMLRSGQGTNWRWSKSSFAQTEQQSRAAAEQLPRRYCLFAHTFTDQPVADDALFPTHLAWVEATLQHCAKSGSYEIVVKPHPLDRLYDKSSSIDHIQREYANHPNISFAGAECDEAWLLRNCTAGITVRGTPGLLMTAAGLPMILAGKGIYSDTGIGIRPNTRNEYFDLLRSGINGLDMAEQKRLTQSYLAFDRIWSPPSCPLVPAFSGLAGGPWHALKLGLDQFEVEQDELFESVADAWRSGDGKVVKRYVWNLEPVSQP